MPGSAPLNWMRPPARMDACRNFAPVLQRHVAQIVTIEMQQIERDEVKILRPARDGRAQRMEVGQPGLVCDDRFAFNDEAFRFEGRGFLCERPIFGRPVDFSLGVKPDAVRVLDGLGAIAVELGFVAPTVARGRLLHQIRLRRPNEW